MQDFCALYDKHLQPDVADIVYVNVLDERADDKDTVLNQLYNEHVHIYRKLWLLSAYYLLSTCFPPVLEHGLLSACAK